MASTEAPMNGNGKPPTTEFELRRENIMGEIGTVRGVYWCIERSTDTLCRIWKAS